MKCRDSRCPARPPDVMVEGEEAMSNDAKYTPHFDVVDLSGEVTPAPKTRHVCVGCRISSPPVATNHTLISSRYGWRLHREVNAKNAEIIYEWRCPACWVEFRARRASTND
jgi:hypothetical protein